MKARILLAAALLAVAPAAAAADKDGLFAIHGGRSCWDYLVWKDSDNGVALAQVDAWVAGYVTAYNKQTPDTADILGNTSLRSAVQWVEKWCRANPKSNLSMAMNALTATFHAQRHKTAKEVLKRP
ncbi:MAG: hypothetical protein AB1452_06320 [Pseudomonadota bacterium]